MTERHRALVDFLGACRTQDPRVFKAGTPESDFAHPLPRTARRSLRRNAILMGGVSMVAVLGFAVGKEIVSTVRSPEFQDALLRSYVQQAVASEQAGVLESQRDGAEIKKHLEQLRESRPDLFSEESSERSMGM